LSTATAYGTPPDDPLPMVVESLESANIAAISSGFAAQHTVAVSGTRRAHGGRRGREAVLAGTIS
jgi:hypothetical protein